MSSAIESICARCSEILVSGKDPFFEVRIEAIADAGTLELDTEKTREEIQDELQSIVEELEELSEREAMDQIARSQVIYLCQSCFPDWIENPAGSH